MIAEILTQWTGSGAEGDANRPSVSDDHAIQKWTDTTGQPAENLQPDPNLYIVKIECDAATLSAIEADANYHVLWSES